MNPMPKHLLYKLLSQKNITDNSLNDESINRLPSIDLQTGYDFLNLNENANSIDNGTFLNTCNDISSPMLPINNYDNDFEYEKEYLERYEKPTNLGTNEGKNNNKNENKFSGNQNKKHIFFCIGEAELNITIKSEVLGRKKKSDMSKRKHNKFSDDNMRRKIKFLVLKNLREFINEKILLMYNGQIGESIYKKQFLTLNKKQIADAVIKNNQIFLNTQIKDILSDNISSKYTNFFLNHNKKLIETLIHDNDENKRKYFTNLFNLTFLDCLKHFRGTEIINELIGLKSFNVIKNNLDSKDEYVKILEYNINNFEAIIMRKKSRKSKPNNKKNKVK